MNNDRLKPSYTNILAARANVYRYLRPTLLHAYAGLSEIVGAEVYVSTRTTMQLDRSRYAAA